MAISTNEVQQSVERKRKRFFNSLPQRLQCSHCKKNKGKEKFGVRLMNGPEVFNDKADPVFRVQPYCTPCRS